MRLGSYHCVKFCKQISWKKKIMFSWKKRKSCSWSRVFSPSSDVVVYMFISHRKQANFLTMKLIMFWNNCILSNVTRTTCIKPVKKKLVTEYINWLKQQSILKRHCSPYSSVTAFGNATPLSKNTNMPTSVQSNAASPGSRDLNARSDMAENESFSPHVGRSEDWDVLYCRIYSRGQWEFVCIYDFALKFISVSLHHRRK